MRLLLITCAIILLTVQLTSAGSPVNSNSLNEVESEKPSIINPQLNPADLYKSDSLEEVSEDGHDETRQLEKSEKWKSWEGKSNVSSSGVRVTSAQKKEALIAIIAAVITAILSNILTKAAIQRLS